MPENLGGYITRVRQILHEIKESSSHYSNTFLKQLFNDNYRRRCTQLTMAHEGYFTDIATRDLVAEQERYAWPNGFERLLKMEIVRSDGRTVPVIRQERHYATKQTASTGVDVFMPTYRPVGSGFVLEPAPSESKTDALRIEYVGLPAELEDDADELHADFPRSFASLLVYDTVASSLDSEDLIENGMVTSILRLRQEFELDFERYIDSRMISLSKITPFIVYPDA